MRKTAADWAVAWLNVMVHLSGGGLPGENQANRIELDNLAEQQQAMGHSSIALTIRYVHVLQGEVTNMRPGVTVTKTAPGTCTG